MPEAFDVALPSRQFGTQVNRLAVEEDRAWALLYASVGRAFTAEEVVKQLDADAQARQSHLALYLRARTTLREQQAAEALNQRIGAFVQSVVRSVLRSVVRPIARSALTLLVIGPFRLLRSMLSFGVGVAAQTLPSARTGPAKGRVSTFKADPEFAKPAVRFTASTHWKM